MVQVAWGGIRDLSIIYIQTEGTGKILKNISRTTDCRKYCKEKKKVLGFMGYNSSMLFNGKSVCRMIKPKVIFGIRKIDNKILKLLEFPRSRTAGTMQYIQ
jgi:hypothetical protein